MRRIETSFFFPEMVNFLYPAALPSRRLSGLPPMVITAETYPRNPKGMNRLEISFGGSTRDQSFAHDDPWNLYDHHIHHLFFSDSLF